MLPTKRHTLSLYLAATLAVAATTVACNTAPQTEVVTGPSDTHHWDDHENQAWHRFLAEKTRPDHEYTKADKNEQSEYWTWRHGHPD
jgi:hypothetical protein